MPPFWKLLIFLLAASVGICRSADSPRQTPQEGNVPILTTVAEIREFPGSNFNVRCPLSLTGIITLADQKRDLWVLQDATGAIALHPYHSNISVKPGQRVALKAASCTPYDPNCPNYPFDPTGKQILSSFEAPENDQYYRLARLRGWLKPPATGNYTFWIASDDSSELWLSSGANPIDARKIAFVKTGNWTASREWTRFPSQRSESIFLKAGQSYYIEALHEQQLAFSHLAVAWEGPKIKQEIIAGQYLTPWTDTNSAKGQETTGILREYWDGFSMGNLSPLKRGATADGGLIINGTEITVLEEGVWPKPISVNPGQVLLPDKEYLWAEGQGAITFLSHDGGSGMIELGSGQNRQLVRVANWENMPVLPPFNLSAKVQGVCEGSKDVNGQLIANYLWAPSGKNISFTKEPKRNLQVTPPLPPTPGPNGAGYYFTRGVITFHDHIFGKECMFVQDPGGGIHIEPPKELILSSLQVGQSVEVGGTPIPGKSCFGIQPKAINILGWQSMPAPVMLPADGSVTNMPDGTWVEMEGIVHSINPNGTILLMGQQSPMMIWIGESDSDRKKQLINSKIQLRGVLSLSTFASPTLLVPSRNFVEIIQSASPVPDEPSSIATLCKTASTKEWHFQEKVAGTVIFRNDQFFYLQDQSGGIRVQSQTAPPLEIGSMVEVVGFPCLKGGEPHLREATWRPIAGRSSITSVILDQQNLSTARNGTLGCVTAQLLSQRKHNTEYILELQTARRVFEAILGDAGSLTKPLEIGSTLTATGVCLLEPLTSENSNVTPDDLQVTLARILLRTPNDVTLLSGPPWWTWKRTAVLISGLMLILAASILRIQYLNHRYKRQQEARLAFARDMLESQESERRRIAASLHDSLGQDLLVIRNQLHHVLQSPETQPTLQQRLEEISTTTLQAIEEVRKITHNLRPYQIDRLGLTQAVRAIIRKVSESCSVEFACSVAEIDGIFDKESEIHIYRIVQEGINNIIKHADSTEATLVIKKSSNSLSISIRDNGRGLDMPGTPLSSGFGLNGMKERVIILSGTINIDSSPGNGVNLQIEIPLPSAQKCNIPSKSLS